MERFENESISREHEQTDTQLLRVNDDILRMPTIIKVDEENRQDTYSYNREPLLIHSTALYSPSRTHPITGRSLQTVTPTGQPQQQSIAPPLLPAFLITGILLGAVVFIIVWRHFVERNRSVLRSRTEGEDEDVWGHNNGGDEIRMRERPEIWEAFTPEGGSDWITKEKWKGWENVLPLSATPFLSPPKRQQPRYLIPSERPTTFMTRMFGGAFDGYRLRTRHQRPGNAGRTDRSVRGPIISNVAYTNQQGSMGSRDLGKGAVAAEEDVIEAMQLSFVIAMPSERRSSTQMSGDDGMTDTNVRAKSGVQDSTKDVSSQEEKTEWEKEVVDGKEKDNMKKVMLPAHGEEGLPELCLGSLMIPYG